jgi:hypothetical protein
MRLNVNKITQKHQSVEPKTTTKHLTAAGAWLVRHRRVPYDIADFIAEMAFRAEACHG